MVTIYIYIYTVKSFGRLPLLLWLSRYLQTTEASPRPNAGLHERVFGRRTKQAGHNDRKQMERALQNWCSIRRKEGDSIIYQKRKKEKKRNDYTPLLEKARRSRSYKRTFMYQQQPSGNLRSLAIKGNNDSRAARSSLYIYTSHRIYTTAFFLSFLLSILFIDAFYV